MLVSYIRNFYLCTFIVFIGVSSVFLPLHSSEYPELDEDSNQFFDFFDGCVTWNDMLQRNGNLDEYGNWIIDSEGVYDLDMITGVTVEDKDNPGNYYPIIFDKSGDAPYYVDPKDDLTQAFSSNSFASKDYSIEQEYRMYMAPLLNMNKSLTFEQCTSRLGVFFCRVVRELEKRSGKKTNVFHRDFISNAFYMKFFNQFNNEIKKKGGKSLNQNHYKIIYDKACMYMEYFYTKGHYRKEPRPVMVGPHVVWIDLKMDEKECIIFMKAFAGCLMIIIPQPHINALGGSLLVSCVCEYMDHQSKKNNKKDISEHYPGVAFKTSRDAALNILN